MRYLCASAVLLAALSSPALADDGKSDGLSADERGITLESGALELNLGGRLHLDAAVFDDPAAVQTGITDAAVRRARIELSGKIGKVIRFRVDREFAGNSKGWRNAWLSVEPVDGVEIKGGNFIVPFAMEDLQSSNTIPFAERSIATALTPGYGLGGAVTVNGKHWSASAGYVTDPLSNDEGRSVERGDGFVGRVTFAPLNASGRIVHFGIGGERRTFAATDAVRFSADAGSTLAPTLMSSGSLRGMDNLTAWTGEAAASFGPVLIIGHVNTVKLNRPLAGDVNFSGQTLQASWLITGGRYTYAEKQGVFGGPDFGKRKSALELAARYSRLDMDDGTVNRGIGRALSGGANWYFTRNIRVMANYTDSRVRFPGGAASLANKVGVLRLQLSY
ncbi:MAG: OprO/OprP family phosphate-selective porin [Novosphingobium sp.]